MEYCVVNRERDTYIVGTKIDIIADIFNWHLDSDRNLVIHVTGYTARILHSYGAAWKRHEDIIIDVTNTLFSKLSEYGWKAYREI